MNSEEEKFYNSFTNVLTLYGVEICKVWLCIPTFYKMTLENKKLKFTHVSVITKVESFEHPLDNIENIERVDKTRISLLFHGDSELTFYCVSEHACDVIYDGLRIMLKRERRRKNYVRIVLDNCSSDSDEQDEQDVQD
jgi:hypothetical protein